MNMDKKNSNNNNKPRETDQQKSENAALTRSRSLSQHIFVCYKLLEICLTNHWYLYENGVYKSCCKRALGPHL